MDIRRQELKNGLVVVSEAMPHLRSVSIGVWVRCGSRFEEPRKNGISHFIEHLLFKGTQFRSGEEIARAIDGVGGQLDAFTDKEYVGFYARVLDKQLPFAIELLSDLVLHPTFPRAEVAREKNVIFEEINTVEDSPEELIHDLFFERFWARHPLGRAVSGSKESVAGITRRDVLDYFRKNYNAANTVLAVAGNIRHRRVQALAGRYFGDLPRGERADLGPPPKTGGGREIRYKKNLEQFHLCLGFPCPGVLSEQRYCLYLLSSILGGGMSSRLFQNIREKKGLVYGIESSLSLQQDAGALLVTAGTAPEAAAKVVRLILREFRLMREKLVSSQELKRAKECVKGALMLSLESSTSRMAHLAHQQMYYERVHSPGEILRAIDHVRARDIRTMADTVFDSAGLTLAAIGSHDNRSLETIGLKV